MKGPVGIAMSGGVDSTAAALLLRRTHQVCGFLMDIGQPGFTEQQRRVSGLAEQLGIELRICDLRGDFDEQVLGYFTTTYCLGRTPNPCLVCNHTIKFGRLMDAIVAAGYPTIVTGHYARIVDSAGESALLQAVDTKKDQSYFLARLSPEQLRRAHFPLGTMTKEQTYRFVEEHGFSDFRGRESQDGCFLQGTTVPEFLVEQRRVAPVPGPIITVAGERIGTHGGLFRYTIGQRRGLGLPHHSPWYVVAIDGTANSIIVGKAGDLFQSTLKAGPPVWQTTQLPRAGDRFIVKIRSAHRGAAAVIESIDEQSFRLHFDEPQRAIAPGQFAVLYSGERVIGCGEIHPFFSPSPAEQR